MSNHLLSVSTFGLFLLLLGGSAYGLFITHRPFSPDLISDGIHDSDSSWGSYPVLNRLSAESSTSTCDQTYGFLPCTTSVMGNLFLMVVYGYLMYFAAMSLTEGSEHLMEILGPGIVGGLVLPILGALPDAMLVIVSGIFGTTETAQSQISIGMGMVAGSTVLLLTIIWGSCVIAGKCDLVDSIAQDAQDTKGFNLTESGISTDIWTSYTAMMMFISVIPLLIVQIPQILDSILWRHIAVLIGLIASLLLLVSYSTYKPVPVHVVEYVPDKQVILPMFGLLNRSECVHMEPSPRLSAQQKWYGSSLRVVTGVVTVTTSPMPKSVQGSFQIIKQCNGITTSISDCLYAPCAGACGGLIYASTTPSRCGSYCGLNASLGSLPFFFLSPMLSSSKVRALRPSVSFLFARLEGSLGLIMEQGVVLEVRSSELETGLSSSDRLVEGDTVVSAPQEVKAFHALEEECGLDGKTLSRFKDKFQFLDRVRVRLPSEEDRACHFFPGEVYFYEATFLCGLRFPIHPFIMELLDHFGIVPGQLMPNLWRIVVNYMGIWLAAMDGDMIRLRDDPSSKADTGSVLRRPSSMQRRSRTLTIWWIHGLLPSSALEKLKVIAVKAVEGFQQTKEYNTVLFSWYFKGFEFLHSYMIKHPTGVDLKNLDMEMVDQEMATDEVAQSTAPESTLEDIYMPPPNGHNNISNVRTMLLAQRL
uniref:Sodium/calcium exchanger membrane region domain-containing protein n=1 Tax=Quercus lobata TaxID=97700 RepID=A0A7N2MBC0_QUELO